ncbi:hydroxymethylglutaryl-CoA reductase [Burkholderia mayonis]|uniref:Hydroxymethylglutaryl-CoA reductase n=1 Tax=Burkholderia mayonis TaxID=1385591 RepID=A0A1B4G2U6_9BURK|nr:hydroxymethylglutaryl-CoA reductase [Burkholderia mayonis]AOJ10220.1 hydroxymethylglutaryl-CoA reductase [Burkholderia mayonis]KVE53798.1 hydroxymethylglutaryl-CoA reductase [Burkholderia mayonis]
MGIPRDSQNDYAAAQIEARLRWVENLTGRRYPHLGGEPVLPEAVKGTCENFTGFVGIPLGLAGPLKINGAHASGEFVVPLATTEGALVASFSRGMSLISDSGGCTTTLLDNALPDSERPAYRFLGDALTKVSAIVLRSASHASAFDAWLRAHVARIVDAANATSRHARLLEVTPLLQGDLVGLAFTYETGNAMGLNMATKANEAACRYIAEQCPQFVEGYLNTLGGDKRFVADQAKGRYVSASARIPAELVEARLRTTPARMRRFLQACNTLLAQRGATAPNIHVANALTALFIACGQDPAFVTVSFKNACTTFDVLDNGDLLAAVTLPNVIVGVVGGGTRLPAQQECLRMLGCEDDARKLAEIAAAVALAGEVSVAGAVSAGEFTRAHTVLGRGLEQAARAPSERAT